MFFGTKLVLNFGTKLVPKFRTIIDSRIPIFFEFRVRKKQNWYQILVPNWYQNLEPFLVHIPRTLLYLVFENAGPNGSHLRAGLMAATMLSGGSVWARATSRQLAQLIAAAGRAALTNLLRAPRVRRLLISTRPRAWRSTRASNLRVCACVYHMCSGQTQQR